MRAWVPCVAGAGYHLVTSGAESDAPHDLNALEGHERVERRQEGFRQAYPLRKGDDIAPHLGRVANALGRFAHGIQGSSVREPVATLPLSPRRSTSAEDEASASSSSSPQMTPPQNSVSSPAGSQSTNARPRVFYTCLLYGCC